MHDRGSPSGRLEPDLAEGSGGNEHKAPADATTPGDLAPVLREALHTASDTTA